MKQASGVSALAWVCVSLAACAATTLETPSDHPANPALNPTTPPEVTAALAPGFDPFSAYPAESTPEAVAYTCPMHPEILRNTPGDCPICGMKLVPKEPAKHSHPAP